LNRRCRFVSDFSADLIGGQRRDGGFVRGQGGRHNCRGSGARRRRFHRVQPRAQPFDLVERLARENKCHDGNDEREKFEHWTFKLSSFLIGLMRAQANSARNRFREPDTCVSVSTKAV
jgi:hypothetical protein